MIITQSFSMRFGGPETHEFFIDIYRSPNGNAFIQSARVRVFGGFESGIVSQEMLDTLSEDKKDEIRAEAERLWQEYWTADPLTKVARPFQEAPR